MNLYKSIAYAYAGSTKANDLGMPDGCFFISLWHYDNPEYSTVSFTDSDCEGFNHPDDLDLIALYRETKGDHCPMFLQVGNPLALTALGLPVI